ncbi:MAG: hypothetical protein EOP83_15335 [Verrucomicrobiaceae bacterium]|nr:MAG: hypothetical protein EOP83_15335 [Verrucomicrobiaceae bacterium]
MPTAQLLRKYVPLQTYTPGLRLHQLLFFMQYMSREIIRASRTRPEALRNREPEYLTIREAEVYYPKNGRSISITTQICRFQNHAPFNASALVGTYQVNELSGKLDNLTEATAADVQGYMDEIADLGWLVVYPREKRINYQITSLPAVLYEPALHGRFLYSDEHNFDPDYIANRVLVSESKWEALLSQRNAEEHAGAIYALNNWCGEHCASDYAWTGAGPIWVFRDPNEAFLFRMMWG